MAVYSSDYDAPFCVEYSHDPNSQHPPLKLFKTLKEAENFYKQKTESFKCVWLGEIGKYDTHFGTERIDWMFFRWTIDTDYGPPRECGRGHGYPADYLNKLTDYEPMFDKNPDGRIR